MERKTAQTVAHHGPMNIRFPDELKRRLEKLAARHRVKTSKLVRGAVKAMLPVWEKRGVLIGHE